MAQEQSSTEAAGRQSFRGVPLVSIPSLLQQIPILSDMQDIPDTMHSLMIKPFAYDLSNPDATPEPFYAVGQYVDKWDEDHVRLPCSPQNLTSKGKPKWPVIQSTLIHLQQKCVEKIAFVDDIREALEECHEARFEIGCLAYLLEKVFSSTERDDFMTRILPSMITLALDVDNICGQSPPLLRIGSNRMVTFSQRQAASLLACAFFCLFPYPIHAQTYQSINFHKLLERGPIWKVEKLKCLLHYFHRVTTRMPNGVITFRRFALPNQLKPAWMQSQNPLSKLHIESDASIEDMHGLLQVDFANQFIGGGVMNEGRVQEEIRFTICPEMLISILLSEVMQSDECIFLIGCEQYVSYTGYADTFQAKADFIDQTPKDNWGRKLSHVVAMDAIYFASPFDQYIPINMERELVKAFTCFRLPRSYEQSMFGIATGHWGCGAFRGDKQLKAMIQLIAASESKRPLVYITWHDPQWMELLWNVYQYLVKQKATAGDLCHYLLHYSKRYHQLSLFDFILSRPPPSRQSGQQRLPTDHTHSSS